MIKRRQPSYTNNTGEVMTERLFIEGKRDEQPTTFSELFTELVPVWMGTPTTDIIVHSAMLSWTRHATQEEVDQWNKWETERWLKQEKWERETYERLKEKYGD